MSPLLVAVIYFVAWRQCRRFGQAFTETAAWIAGYLGTFVILTVAHVGRPDLVSLAPESWEVVLPIGGGFIVMKLSHWLWRRRGGHLEPAKNPFAIKHWARALGAMFFGGKAKQSAARRTAQPRSATSPAVTTTARTARPPASAAQPTGTATPSTSVIVARRAAAATRSAQSSRWARVARAMLDTEKTNGNSRPRS